MKERIAAEQNPATSLQPPAQGKTDTEAPSPAAFPWQRLAGALLAGIPFFCTLPYTFQSWRSPMDSMNWIFHLAFLLLAVCAAPAVKDSAKTLKCFSFDIPSLLFVIGFALLYGTGVVRQIYMVRILAGIGFWWSGVWLFCGWPGAWMILPAFGTLLLGSTSTTFLMCNILLVQPQTALFLKLAAAVLCAALLAVVLLTDYVMKYEVLCFLFAAALILFGAMTIRKGDRTTSPFRPDLTSAPDGFTVTELPLTEDSIRFFEGAEVHQYMIGDGMFQGNILEVKCGDNIHKIHPASHCLRSSGAEIQSESVVMHAMPDGRSLPVTEIRSRIRGIPVLTFVWYTGPRETTGSFFSFRRKWSPSDQWYSYQVVTEIYNGNEDAARDFLLGLLSKY